MDRKQWKKLEGEGPVRNLWSQFIRWERKSCSSQTVAAGAEKERLGDRAGKWASPDEQSGHRQCPDFSCGSLAIQRHQEHSKGGRPGRKMRTVTLDAFV